jgi:hypothetical protein
MGVSEDDIDAFEDDSGIGHRPVIDTDQMEEVMTMRIKMNRIAPLVAVGAAAVAIAAAPIAAAAPTGTTNATGSTGSTVDQTQGSAQITAVPGAAAQQAAQLQQPFGGDMGALLFHNHH